MKKFKSKIIPLIIAILIVSLTLIACSKGNTSTTPDSNKNEKIKISVSTWGSPTELDVFKKVVADFEKVHPDISVEILHIPSDYSTKMNTMIAGGTAPDVIFTSDGDFPRWVKQGAFLNIQKYVDNSKDINLEDMWESGLKRYMFDGQRTGTGDLYALPKDIGPTVMVYNKDIFDKLGVPYPPADRPLSWQEALDMWQKLTVRKNGKIEIYGSGPIWWEGFVWSNGGSILSENRKEFTLHEPKAAEAMQFIHDLTWKYKVVPDSRALQAMNDAQMFQTGRLATITAGRWSVPDYRKLKFDWDVAPIPTPTGEWTTNGWSGSVGLAVNAKTKHPEEAYKLVEWFAGPNGQKRMTELGFSIPNFKSMANTDLFLQPDQKPKHAEVYIKEAEVEAPGAWTYLPNGKWWDVLNQKLGLFWQDQNASAVEFFTKIKPEIDKAIREGNPELFE
ncbi:ABC transporter substrate-binding protein [Thermoanaerobacter mathranii]|uniref:ABC transporter substrate-binding protein n=1 Tax=Thermoanaerobacter mathranii TaxID=583357 RepID=UPI003D6A1207